MSRNAEKNCIDAVEEREDQMRNHRREYLESIAPQMAARRVVTLQEEVDKMKEALELLLAAAENSDNAFYGTLSTSFVREVAASALEAKA